MLIRPHDDATGDEARWRRFVSDQGFGHLAAAGIDRDVPVVVPTQYLLDESVVRLHLAKQNPIFEALAENPACVLSVAGDWAYIPGSWKAVGDEDPRLGIPTTYYGAVQLTCTVAVEDGPEAIATTLAAQLSDLEPDGDYVDPIEHGARLGAIRALVLTIDDVRAKFKFGGNVDEAHRAKVAGELMARQGPGDAAALAHLQLPPAGS